MPHDGNRLRPLIARPGARYACFGDGLCCTHAHALGPLTPRESQSVRALRPDAVVRHETMRLPMIRTTQAGGCVFLSARGCEIHATQGAEHKPASCRRFPLRLVATPEGGRIATAHRCPCRSLGDRPLLDLADAERALSVAGRLQADARAPAEIALAHDVPVSFAEYRVKENALLTQLSSSEGDPAQVLESKAFPELRGISWRDVAHHFRGKIDGTSCGDALATFGDTLLALLGEPRAARARTWREPFDRAEARATRELSAVHVVRDWLADEIWSLEWTARGTFAQARAELTTRALVAETLTEVLVRTGARPDRAAAEALLVAELAGASTSWPSVVEAIAP